MQENKTSFWDIITKYEIQIPKIQRDYAQGRNDDKTKRIVDNFLNEIKNAIVNSKELLLDFIYGKIEDNCLIPLDGQQRLTTLFLLHWYFAKKENKLTGDVCETLKKFSYEIRLSSIDFCKSLIDPNNVDTLDLKDKNLIPIQQIENCSWFFLNWKRDPTIVAMLNMIDTIHRKFHDETEYDIFETLTSKSSPIKFYFLPMHKFKLGDELYIKMNARGKLLSDFENFKAIFTEYLDENNKRKMDNEWLDIFWKWKNDKDKGGNNETITQDVDKAFFNFFTNISLNFYAEQKSTLSKEYIEKAKNGTFIFEKYAEIYKDPELVGQVKIILDALPDYLENHENKDKIFEKF